MANSRRESESRKLGGTALKYVSESRVTLMQLCPSDPHTAL